VKTPYNEADYQSTQKLIKRIIHTLADPNTELPDFKIRKTLHHCSGILDDGENGDSFTTIGIFYDPIGTVIHECIHFLHSEWRETKVLKHDKMVRRYISIKQLTIIVKLFAKML
jgi:hypothetical protein